MLIHFVCSGNTYRSRLAEAYLNSKQISGTKAVSSGINAKKLAVYPIRWYTEKLSEENNLEKYMAASWRQVSQELLEKSDFIVFFSQEVFKKCLMFNFNKPYKIWDISDVDLKKTDEEIIMDTRKTFSEIKKNVEDLLQELKVN